jgi:hypothetical protein
VLDLFWRRFADRIAANCSAVGVGSSDARQGPELRSPAQQLAALFAELRAKKEERDGQLELKQIAAAVHQRMQAVKVQGLLAARDQPYSVSHLSGVLNPERPRTPSRALARTHPDHAVGHRRHRRA